MASVPKNSIIKCQDLFLPESLVRLVIKICKSFEISRHDQFSILETLNFALFSDYQRSKDKIKNEQEICIIIINIIRLCEKFNNASSKFVKNADSIFKELGINPNVYNVTELEAYNLMQFDVKNPAILEDIYDLIEKNLDIKELKNHAFDYANEVLILLYYYKNRIYDEFRKSMTHEDCLKIIRNQKLQATAVFFVVLKIINFSKYNDLFEKICNDLKEEMTGKEVNQLCAVIFGLIKL